MGERIALGVLAVIVACGLSSAAAPVQAVPIVAAPVAHQEHLLDPDLADKLVAETPLAEPEHTDSKWASCGLTMNIDYAAGPGVDPETIRRELAYPVRYLQALGYVAAIGLEVPYAHNQPTPTTPGTVLVVATLNPSEQPDIRSYRASVTYGHGWPAQSTGKVNVDANTGLSSLVLLHELGHTLGLGHKDGTVMSANGTDSNGFDAAETAAIDCRVPNGKK